MVGLASASKDLTFNLFGKDKSAGKTLDSLGVRAFRVAAGVGRAVSRIALAVAGLVAGFAVTSLQAAADAETQQLKLSAAYEKFPALLDVNIDALRKYNTQLATKTKYDDDAIAAGQAQLAQFNLTGKQIQKLTPLLLDYASKTGKDLPTAAGDLGKALLGQARALKAIGIEFKTTGDNAADFENLVGLLQEKVGGFAEKEGDTAAGKLEILKNRFGEVQEAVGNALLPALDDLIGFINVKVLPGMEDFGAWFEKDGMPAVRDFVGWLERYPDVLGLAATAVGLLTIAQWGLNAAMLANPIGAIIAAAAIGIAELIAAFVVMRTNAAGAGEAIFGTFLNIGRGIVTAAEFFVNASVGLINAVLGPLNIIRNALGLKSVTIPQATFSSQFNQWADRQILGYQIATGTVGTGSKKFGGHAAAGAIVPPRPGGWMMNVGEGRETEVIAPLSKLGALGGGGDTYQITVHGYVGDEDRLVQKLARSVENSKRRGAVPRAAFGR